MVFLLWLLLAYICGALPWSVWLGRLFFQRDPRTQADGNPGTANAFRAAGWRLGVAVLVLDFFKAFIPVAIANWRLGFPASQLFWIALMPTIGHAFSIFLRLRGGRGIVAMFGVWTALTLYRAPLVMGATAIISLFVFHNDDYRTLAIPAGLLAYLLVTQAPLWMIALVLAQVVVLLLKIGTQHHQMHSQQAAEKRTQTS